MPRKKTTSPAPVRVEPKPNAIAALVIAVIKTFRRGLEGQQSGFHESEAEVQRALRSVLVDPALSIALAWVESEREVAKELTRLRVEATAIAGVAFDMASLEPMEGGDPDHS